MLVDASHPGRASPMIPDGSACFAALIAMAGLRITNPAAVAFTVLMMMAGVWLASIAWLFRRLRTRHASAYEAMGSPSLFRNNSPRTVPWFLAFLFSPAHHELRDGPASRVVLFLRAFLVLYLVAFFATIALIWSGAP
jgi:hypothetical protein